MRPGKPLMAGKMGSAAMVGLPGNPVSAMVCGEIFIKPMIQKLLGLSGALAQTQNATLAAPLGENGPRKHFMRAVLTPDGLTAFASQDSAKLSILAAANALIVRDPHDGSKEAGDTVPYLPL